MFGKLSHALNRSPSHNKHTHAESNPHGEGITGVYFSNWSIYERNHFPTDIDWQWVNHLYYAFLSIDTNTGSVSFSDTWADVEVPLPSPLDPSKKVHGLVAQLRQIKQLHPQLKIMFSIGGWGYDHTFEAITHDARKLDTFASQCAKLVIEHGFDGVDIDWEYPKTAAQGQLYCRLLETLREKFCEISPSLLITAAVPGSEEYIRHLDVKRMDNSLDYWNVMCYDFTGYSWSQKTGFHSNLFGANGDTDLCADVALKSYGSRGVAANKLMLGMPLYGRKFGGVEVPGIGQSFDKQKFSDEGIIEYAKLPLNHSKEVFDPRKVGAYCYDPTTKTLVTYDNVDSAKVKAVQVSSRGLAGGFYWDSAGDKHGELIRTFSEMLRHSNSTSTH
ncbi:Chitinase 4 [Yamadazyma tenuis]|uniref:chitinase n=1 Tax=Candida tenuis (strain ATCC 10573 / BCRC 21748 / CBS 615 / JCM 9827 / NBRC 10315 / NRRL Y-1498 / VKM Y-70) TaxID=590646 RepID=G3AZ51_CANTC|nr:uncharacterized protein CANTEDRAFT_129438 [Yamadazyma tenuis ATCC 10573]EGV66010.1 hypothetical protein CANTEDRAFT_129438 [Yamadazyma tenuis ATCC 10573]WEJ95651.1 Chitinase 4 [Yamadazyma tenuis]